MMGWAIAFGVLIFCEGLFCCWYVWKRLKNVEV